MSLLIIGGTGTLGRQVVLQALTKGYQVRCLVRNFRKANFLKDWGVELVYGDLTRPETIPPCLKGITAVIDVSTSRANELDSLKKVDWDGKLCLIESAKAANVKRFIFFSTQNVEQFENIPLMKLKYGIEQKLKESKIPYTIFRLTGFYQGLIEQYAIPILENLPIWVTNENTNRLILAVFAASIKHNFPSQSTFFKVSNSFGRLVDASIIAVIPFKQGGIVSGRVRSP